MIVQTHTYSVKHIIKSMFIREHTILHIHTHTRTHTHIYLYIYYIYCIYIFKNIKILFI